MSFETGLKLFRDGDFVGASREFQKAVEQDENNAKAWNALGICFSKLGEYENAGTCYDNALMLDPGNTTYEKNLDKNNQKIPIITNNTQKIKKTSNPSQKQESPDNTSVIWKGIKLVGGVLVFIFIFMVVASFIFGMANAGNKQPSDYSNAPAQISVTKPVPSEILSLGVYEWKNPDLQSTEIYVALLEYDVIIDEYAYGFVFFDELKDQFCGTASFGGHDKREKILMYLGKQISGIDLPNIAYDSLTGEYCISMR